MTPTELADALDREADRGITELPNRIVDLLTQASHALRRLGADAATLTHRAEVAERSCEDAKRREQETSAKMQAMAQSESNKALRARAEAAERELAEVHRGVESVALHDARVARDAATARAWAAEQSLADRTAQMTREISDLRAALTEAAGTVGPASYVVQLRESAALWRERCNRAEARSDAVTTELLRLYAAVCHGQTRSDDARAIVQAVIDEYVQTAEQCDRNDTLLERMGESRSLCIEALRGVQATGDVDAQTWDVVADGIRALRERCDKSEERAGTWMWQRTEMLHSLRRARFLSAGWRRLARHYQSCHLAGHACLRETHRAKGEQVAALRRARDDDAAYRSDLMEQCDALRAKLARAEGVVAAARAVAREHDRYLSDEVGTMGHVDEACDALRAALATYEEG